MVTHGDMMNFKIIRQLKSASQTSRVHSDKIIEEIHYNKITYIIQSCSIQNKTIGYKIRTMRLLRQLKAEYKITEIIFPYNNCKTSAGKQNFVRQKIKIITHETIHRTLSYNNNFIMIQKINK